MADLELRAALPPADWGVIYAIRSGSADFIKRCMIGARRRKRRVHEGRVLRECSHMMADIWVENVSYRVVSCPEEEDLFRECGMALAWPSERNG